ncbi:hypothetical protein B3C1_19049 [Gallaecimonas xiamenensis 3-C-1]|uniref:Uncharacterized protein n=1 Tax=Gallaecimonas xiamenensis 3-C-1 TaxID=745411 RepID=K2JPR4_9GAMM|nr:hypothetical protein B3C1_19049 [Gallaecimonas xiamenensis 3-C-1]
MGWEDLEPVKIRRKKYYPAVWSQDHGDDEVLLVVQLTKWHVPQIIGTTDCIGLIKNRMNRTIDVDALWLMHHIGYP